MDFINGAKPEDFIDKEVELHITHGELTDCLSFKKCFVKDGLLCVEIFPVGYGENKNGLAIALPPETVFALNEQCLEIGRYNIFVPATTYVGKQVLSMINQAKEIKKKKK